MTQREKVKLWIHMDNPWHGSNWHGKTHRLEVDPWAAVEPVPYLCAVSLNPSDEKFSKPKCVSRERQTKISPSTKDFTHVNRFSSFTQGDNELSCENCTSAHTSKAQCHQRVDERGDGCVPNTESKGSRHQQGSSQLKQSVQQVSYLAVSGDGRLRMEKSECDCRFRICRVCGP